jgi:hypothetical protein
MFMIVIKISGAVALSRAIVPYLYRGWQPNFRVATYGLGPREVFYSRLAMLHQQWGQQVALFMQLH